MVSIEITYNEIRELFSAKRRRDAQKGDFGRVLVVAGSVGMAGAAILCAKGALRAGAGLVTISVPDRLLPVMQAAVPDATCIPRSFTPELLDIFDSIVVGPGLGVTEEAKSTVFSVLENYGGKVVLDADALNILSASAVSLDTDTIITPHPGEAGRLLGTTTAVVQKRREAAAAYLAEKFECVAVLKGAGTLVSITKPNMRIYVNPTGNPGMAVGGSGDVLAGVIATFAAQGMTTLTAARAGVFVHGLAGDIRAAEVGETGLIANDLPLAVAYALKQLSS